MRLQRRLRRRGTNGGGAAACVVVVIPAIRPWGREREKESDEFPLSRSFALPLSLFLSFRRRTVAEFSKHRSRARASFGRLSGRSVGQPPSSVAEERSDSSSYGGAAPQASCRSLRRSAASLCPVCPISVAPLSLSLSPSSSLSCFPGGEPRRSLARSLSSSQPRSQPQPLSQQQLVHEERAEWPPSRPSSLAFSLHVYPPLRSNRPRMTAAAPHAFAAASNLTSRRRHRRYDRHSTVAVFFTCASS